ncbi:Phosphoheptose isomerase [uncultured virus]|nr:Phosphoheptose isomerase [uncultured virus]
MSHILLELVQPYISSYKISGQDLTRPWGGFYYINNNDLDRFVKQYFRGVVVNMNRFLSPKILIINSNKRLSWQYHHRREEIWSVLVGPVGIVRSDNDEETPMIIVNTGDIIKIGKEERHRIVGLDNPAIVAELWSHTDESHLSDENDIVRVQDDFKR